MSLSLSRARSQDFQHARPGMLNSSSVSRSHLRRKNSGSCDGWTWVSDVIAQICALFLSLRLESAAVRSNGNFSSLRSEEGAEKSTIRCDIAKCHFVCQTCLPALLKFHFLSLPERALFKYRGILPTALIIIPLSLFQSCYCYVFLLIISRSAVNIQSFSSLALPSRYIWIFNEKGIKKCFLYLNVFWCV